MTSIKRLLEECGCLIEGDDFHFVGARQMHLQKYCDLWALVQSQELLNAVGYRIAEAYSASHVSIVAAVSPVDRLLAETVAAQLHVMKGRRVTVQDSCKVDASTSGGVLIADTFCDDITSIQANLVALRGAGRLVLGVCSAVAVTAVNEVLLGVPRFVTGHRLGGAMYDPWSCVRSGPCSRGVPVVVGFGGGDTYSREHPDSPVVRLASGDAAGAVACE